MEGVKRQVMELKNLRWSGKFSLFHQILLAIMQHAKLSLDSEYCGWSLNEIQGKYFESMN